MRILSFNYAVALWHLRRYARQLLTHTHVVAKSTKRIIAKNPLIGPIIDGPPSCFYFILIIYEIFFAAHLKFVCGTPVCRGTQFADP